MPPLFSDNLALERAPGVYAIELAPPVVIQGQVLGYIGFVFQGEWGPMGVVGEPSGTAEFNTTYFPPGSPHNSTGYYALMRRKRMPLRPVRITPTGTAPATAAVVAAAGTGTYTLTARYPGALGNSIVATWRAATDGDAAHRDLELTLSNATTGVTTERVRNIVLNTDLDLTVTSANLPGGSNLLASLTFSTGSALPAAGASVTLGSATGATSATAGSNGVAVAADYTTALALLALRTDLFVVCTDDPGDSLRDAVNDALVAHVAATRRSLAVFQSSAQGASWSTVKSDVNNSSPTYRSDRTLPQGAWVKVQDDTGVERITPWTTFVASALVNTEPQQSHAWRDEIVTQLYSGVASIYAPFNTADSDIQGDATEQGIGLPVKIDSGHAALHDRTSSLTAGKKFTITRRLKDFFARALVTNLQSYVNGSNWRGRHLEVKALVDAFFAGESPEGRPNDPRVVTFATNIDSVNTSGTIAAGNFSLGIDARTPSVMEKIGLLFNVGETVTVRETT